MHPKKVHLSANYISLPNGTQGYTLAFLKVGLASNKKTPFPLTYLEMIYTVYTEEI